MEIESLTYKLLDDSWSIHMAIISIAISIITLLYSLAIGKREELKILMTILAFTDYFIVQYFGNLIRMLKNSYNRFKVLQIENKETNKYPQNNLLKYNRLLKGSKLLITL